MLSRGTWQTPVLVDLVNATQAAGGKFDDVIEDESSSRPSLV